MSSPAEGVEGPQVQGRGRDDQQVRPRSSGGAEASELVVVLHPRGRPSGAGRNVERRRGGSTAPVTSPVAIKSTSSRRITPEGGRAWSSAHTHQRVRPAESRTAGNRARSFGRRLRPPEHGHRAPDRPLVARHRVRPRAATAWSRRTSPRPRSRPKLLARYNALAAPIGNRVVGSISGRHRPRRRPRPARSPLGAVIADAQLGATARSRPAEPTSRWWTRAGSAPTSCTAGARAARRRVRSPTGRASRSSRSPTR